MKASEVAVVGNGRLQKMDAETMHQIYQIVGRNYGLKVTEGSILVYPERAGEIWYFLGVDLKGMATGIESFGKALKEEFRMDNLCINGIQI